jgi:hypothetical protein
MRRQMSKTIGLVLALLGSAAVADTTAEKMPQYAAECGELRARVSDWIPKYPDGPARAKLNAALAAAFNCQQAAGGKTPFFWARFPMLRDDANARFAEAKSVLALAESLPDDRLMGQYEAHCLSMLPEAKGSYQRLRATQNHLGQTLGVAIRAIEYCAETARGRSDEVRRRFPRLVFEANIAWDAFQKELEDCAHGKGEGCVAKSGGGVVHTRPDQRSPAPR